MSKALISILILLTFGIISCETRDAIPIDEEDGAKFFPLVKGSYVEYEVEEIKLSIILGKSTKKYFLKEKVSDSLLDSYNKVSYSISRYKKDTLSKPWKIDSVWTVRRNNNEFIKTENNVPFVKLVIPIQEGKEWNANTYNVRGKEIYKMQMVNKPFNQGSLKFDSTVTQLQRKDSSSISQDYRYEIYARNVGLIYKKSIITSNHQSNGTIVIPIEIDKGIEYTQKIIGYGKE